MKRLFTLFLLLSICQFASAQQFGGLHISPIFLTNKGQNFNWSVPEYTPDKNETTLGYAVGYQGLLLPYKRFSISYGINYVKTFMKHYDDSDLLNSGDQDNYRLGYQSTFKDLEIPLALRWNFVKKGKFQPYVSLAPVVIVPIKTRQDYIFNDNSRRQMSGNYSRKVGLQLELGAGINYYVTDKCLINLHMGYRRQTSDIYRFGAGISFIYRF